MKSMLLAVSLVVSSVSAWDSYFPMTKGSWHSYTMYELVSEPDTGRERNDGFRWDYRGDTIIASKTCAVRTKSFPPMEPSEYDQPDFIFQYENELRYSEYTVDTSHNWNSGQYLAPASLKPGNVIKSFNVNTTATNHVDTTWYIFKVIDNGPDSVPAGKFPSTVAVVRNDTNTYERDSVRYKLVAYEYNVYALNVGLIKSRTYSKNIDSNEFTFNYLTELDSFYTPTSNSVNPVSLSHKDRVRAQMIPAGLQISASSLSPVSLSVYNISGRLLLKKQITSKAVIPFQELGMISRGSYILSINGYALRHVHAGRE